MHEFSSFNHRFSSLNQILLNSFDVSNTFIN